MFCLSFQSISAFSALPSFLEGTTLSDILCREAPPERGKFIQMLLVRLEVECMKGLSAGISEAFNYNISTQTQVLAVWIFIIYKKRRLFVLVIYW